MQELPKRNDAIYKEIEAFEDYEYSNCIAYEMAIRNNRVKELLERQEELEPDILDLDLDSDGKLIRKEINLISHELIFDYFINANIFHLLSKNYSTYLLTIEKHEPDTFYSNLQFHKITSTSFNCKKIHSNDIEFISSVNVEGVVELDYKKKQSKAVITNLEFLSIKRPRLFVPQDISKELTVNINLALPKEELIALILKMKDDYDKDNKIVQAPLEFLGEELKYVDTEIKSKSIPKDKEKRKKALADAFYVYDLWELLEKEYQEKKDALKAKRANKIQKLKDNIEYSKEEREERTEELNEYYKDELRQYDSPSLKAEISSQSKFSIDTIEKHKSLMNKYINELKYKELITGVST